MAAPPPRYARAVLRIVRRMRSQPRRLSNLSFAEVRVAFFAARASEISLGTAAPPRYSRVQLRIFPRRPPTAIYRKLDNAEKVPRRSRKSWEHSIKCASSEMMRNDFGEHGTEVGREC